MRAALYMGPKLVELTEQPDYVCGDNDAVLQTLVSSICGTDAAVYQHGTGLGHHITVGGEFGHETVCRVAAVGKNVQELHVGDRVYPYPRLVTGNPARAGTIGGFSEYIYAVNPKLYREVYPVSQRISDKEAALIEPFTVGCRTARRAMPHTGEKAVVFGAGTIGLSAAIALQFFGCGQVLLCDRSDFRLSICEKLGLPICNNSKKDFMDTARQIFGPATGFHGDTADIDIWVDAAGAEPVLTDYEQRGKYNSRMVIVAVGTNVRPVDILGLTFGQKAIIGSGGYAPEDVEDVMKIMESGRWDIERLITHVFSWEELPEALDTASDPSRSLNVEIYF